MDTRNISCDVRRINNVKDPTRKKSLLGEYSFANAWANDRTLDREPSYAAKFALVLMASKVLVKIKAPTEASVRVVRRASLPTLSKRPLHLQHTC